MANNEKKFVKIVNEVLVTDEEMEIVSMLSKGLTYKEMAAKLKINIRTLETKRENMFKKYECINSCHLVGVFYRNKLID